MSPWHASSAAGTQGCRAHSACRLCQQSSDLARHHHYTVCTGAVPGVAGAAWQLWAGAGCARRRFPAAQQLAAAHRRAGLPLPPGPLQQRQPPEHRLAPAALPGCQSDPPQRQICCVSAQLGRDPPFKAHLSPVCTASMRSLGATTCAGRPYGLTPHLSARSTLGPSNGGRKGKEPWAASNRPSNGPAPTACVDNCSDCLQGARGARAPRRHLQRLPQAPLQQWWGRGRGSPPGGRLPGLPRPLHACRALHI